MYSSGEPITCDEKLLDVQSSEVKENDPDHYNYDAGDNFEDDFHESEEVLLPEPVVVGFGF